MEASDINLIPIYVEYGLGGEKYTYLCKSELFEILKLHDYLLVDAGYSMQYKIVRYMGRNREPLKTYISYKQIIGKLVVL